MSSINAQTFSKSLTNNVLNGGQVLKQDGTLQSLSQGYIIEAKKEDDSQYFKVEIISDNNKKESFKIYPLSLDMFIIKFKNTFLKVVDSAENITSDKNTVFNKLELSLLFAQLFTFQRTENERPVVANITLKNNIPVMIPKFATKEIIDKISALRTANKPAGLILTKQEKKIQKKVNSNIRKIKKTENELVEVVTIDDAKLELTFYNGFIEKIELEAKVKNLKIRFTNVHSVGISSSNGIKRFVENYINSFYTYSFDGTNLKRDGKGSFLRINLADIIDYDRELDINANDISPEPTKLVLDESNRETKLYKEESTKLFEAIVYSDFLGVFDEENPNGIIQTEVAKRFFINTQRTQISKKGRICGGFLFFPIWFSEGIGLFEYIDVNAKLSKIEENNKFLEPKTIDGINFFEPLRIMQHQSFSIGADVNVLYLENQNKKINTNLDIGFRYGRSGLQLEENVQNFFNTFSATTSLGFRLIPEKRYGFTAIGELAYFQVFDDDELNVLSIEDKGLTKPNKIFSTASFEFFVNTSTTGKLFMRYNFTSELRDWDNNFSQFQFGYSFYLLKQNGKSK